MPKKIYIIIILIIALPGCKEKENYLNDLNNSKKLATIDKRPISESEFNAFLKFKRIPEKNKIRQKQHFDNYLHREALADAIEKSKMLDHNMIKAELNEFRKEMLISRYFEKYLSNEVSDTDVQKYYQKHVKEFEFKKAHAAHILIRTNKKMSETEKNARLTTTHEVFSKLRAGKDFAEMVRQYSQDQVSSKKEGDLGWIKTGSIDPQFSDTLFSLKPGDISSPIETRFGYHIVKLLDKVQTARQSFDDVSGNIRYQLRAKAKQMEMERLMSTVRVVNQWKDE